MEDLELLKNKGFKGNTSWVNPDQSYVLSLPEVQNVPSFQENVTKSTAGQAFSAGFIDSLFTVKNSIVNLISENINIDPEYSPFEDSNLKDRGDDFVAQYGDDFVNSPNPSHTKRLLDRIDLSTANAKLYSEHPVAAIAGTLTGSLGDIGSYLFFAGLPVKAGLLANTAVRTLEGAALGAGFTAVQGSYDPTITNDDIITASLFGAGLGAMIGGVGGFVNKKEINTLTDWYKKGSASEDPIDLNNLDSISAARNLQNIDNLDIAETNSVFKGMLKVAQTYSPAADMAGMSTPVMKELSQSLAGSTILTKGTLKGFAGEDALMYKIEAARNSKLIPHENEIDDAYVEYKKAGGKLSKTNFELDSFLAAGKGTVDNPEMLGKSSAAFRKYFDEYAKYNKDNNLLSKDANLEDDWLMHYTDHDKIVENFDLFKQTLKPKVRASINGNLDNYIEDSIKKNLFDRFDIDEKSTESVSEMLVRQDPELRKELVDEIANDEINRISNDIRNSNSTLYRMSVKGFTAKSLRERTLNLSTDEIKPFLRTDVRDVVRQYTKSVETTRFLNEELMRLKGLDPVMNPELGDPYHELNSLINEQYSNLLNKAKNPEQRIQLDKEQKKAIKLVQDQLDLLTGNMSQRDRIMFSDSFRKVSTVSKWLNTLRMGGTFAIASINDIGSTLATKLVNNLGLHDYISPLINKVVNMSKTEKEIMGSLINDFRGRSHNLNFADIIETNGLKPRDKTQKVMDAATNGLFYTTLFSHVTGFARGLAVKDGINTNLKRIEKLINGKLKEGSYDQIELADFGYGVNNIDEAKKVLDQFQKHRTKEGNVYYSNMDKWTDTDTSYAFMAKLLKYRNRIVVEPDNGTKPAFFYNSLGGMIGQFKGFTLSAFLKQLVRRTQTINLSGEHAQVVLASFVFNSMLGMLSGYLRDSVMGRGLDISPEKSAFYAFDRGGFLPIFDYMNGLADQHGFGLATNLGVKKASRFGQQGLLSPLLGPSFSYIDQDLGKAIKGVVSGNADATDLKKVLKVMPLYNFPYWAWLTNNIDK